MSVRSVELKDGQVTGQSVASQPTTKKTVSRGSSQDTLVRTALFAAGILALGFGIPGWVVGAWCTVKGWVIALNIVFAFVGSAIRVTLPAAEWTLLLFPVGIIYSLTETVLRPGRRLWLFVSARYGWQIMLLLLLLWSITIVTDLGTTYLSITSPESGASALAQWVATTQWAAVTWTGVLTFFPELLIIGGVILVVKK